MLTSSFYWHCEFTNIYRTFSSFWWVLVSCQQAWNILCRRKRQTGGFAVMLWHSLSFSKRDYNAWFPLHLARWCWRRGNGQFFNSLRCAFRVKDFVEKKVPFYSPWPILRLEGCVVRRRLWSFPAFNGTENHRWCWNTRRVYRLRWLGTVIIILLSPICLYYRHCW